MSEAVGRLHGCFWGLGWLDECERCCLDYFTAQRSRSPLETSVALKTYLRRQRQRQRTRSSLTSSDDIVPTA